MGDREFLDAVNANSINLSQDSQLSVSSSQSLDLSTAEGADTPNSKSKRSEKKTKKRSKHEKSSKSKDKDKSVKERSGTPVCDIANNTAKSSRSSKSSSKCDFSEKKHKRHTSRRPDPEGGNPLQTDSNIILEYDRIINSTDPLFSDLENDNPSEEKDTQQRQRRSLRLNRGGTTDGIFIPCAQLGISSNTMIKFAIIGTELQNIFKILKRVRTYVCQLSSLQITTAKVSSQHRPP